MSKDRFVKQAKIGDVWWNLWVNDDAAGASYKGNWHPEKPHRITIGLADLKDYSEAYALLLHETVEIALEQHNGTNYRENTITNHSAYKRFAFSHEDFQYAIMEASMFLTAVAAEYYAQVHRKYPELPRFCGEKPLMGKGKK